MLDLGAQTLLVVAPHPDDDVLGCGGLISRVKQEGGAVFVLFLTVGRTHEFTATGFSTAEERIEEIREVAKLLAYDGWRIAFEGDSYHLRLDALPQAELIHEIEAGAEISVRGVRPTVILTPCAADYNQDHRACTEAVFSVTRAAPDGIKPLQRVVLGYESVPAEWSVLPPSRPNLFVELKEPHLRAKQDALELYRSQVRPRPHLRSVETLRSLAGMRGAQCGMEWAEAFFAYRIVV
jgi:LmbE family N-acetylglucosaminyl deacetylase